MNWHPFSGIVAFALGTGMTLIAPAQNAMARAVAQTIDCELLVVGSGISGVATAYEALLGGREVCMTELTDWVGGQISAQGTSALDETVGQRTRQWFPRGYLEMRQRLIQRTGRERPGDCWVSLVCFLPREGHEKLTTMLQEAEQRGRGQLHWFPNTVVKDLQINPVGNGEQIQAVRAIQHQPAPGAPPLNRFPLSEILADVYTETDSERFTKTILEFVPPADGNWLVIEATETGELLALADVPYRLGIDPLTYRDPSASSAEPYPYCTQAFTYTFAMEATETPQPAEPPAFYAQYEPFYSLDLPRYGEEPKLVFTYRRIYSAQEGTDFRTVNPGDISMQNWGGGNDYGPGTPIDNFILTREQLAASGQLQPGGWQGGLRISSLRGGEELAQGYFYWLRAGTTDSKLGDNVKQPWPNVRYLQGLDSPMGTEHGLSKYPYIRESRRVIGRPSYAYPESFKIRETDVSRQDFRQPYYQSALPGRGYRDLATSMAGLHTLDVILGRVPVSELEWRTRSRLYPDSVGIGHYPIDFHPCMLEHPPEKPGNIERPGERQGATTTYPYQIPLRAMIPQRIDNLLVTGKSIATSHISAATYRVHGFEWSAGAAAGTTAVYALETGILPYQLVENLPRHSPELEQLQQRLNAQGNPTAFPDMSIFNLDWQGW
ncbi:FAD-dependent oxidoreductase [Synechococcales cyanobacterium C]|uniref:FAD-dependent oxidoreductase n=1 Tax=Petrachloros mirabilis ULC683 TaxID=2781853 RepID=A0A8K1ZX64_9CYAN|nr:FAD-dependent oxidoreductase [Petrachloros mirabilis]NCJ06528.1 FAD-dependent oxidoreductase [Petrachloros mirabilis ULC683]